MDTTKPASDDSANGRHDDQGNAEQHVQQQQKSSKDESEQAKSPSKLKQIWAKIDLDLFTLLLMFKGSLPPVIAIAAYQAPAFARHFGTLGYLVAITSVLGFCIMPRGKFVQTMLLNILGVCVAAAVNLLAIYCVISARIKTAQPGSRPNAYNASASTVAAIWLIFQIYLINCLRAARPQFQFPVIIYSIFVSVSLTYGTQFPTMTYAISFMDQLIEAFLSGFALATGVSLFVIPISSRMVVFKQMQGYLLCLGGLLHAQIAWMQSLEEYTPGTKATESDTDGNNGEKKATNKDMRPNNEPFKTPEATKVQDLIGKTLELHTKIPGDLAFAKREVAIGKIGSHDLSELWKHMQQVMIPILGLTTVVDILRRRATQLKFDSDDVTEEQTKAQTRHVTNVRYLMKALHEPFQSMVVHINAAFQHVLITLEFIKPPKKKQDEESTGDAAVPGSPAFAGQFKRHIDEFYESKKQTLKDWCVDHNIELPADFFETTFVNSQNLNLDDEHSREKNQRQLFFILHLEYLLWRAGSAALDLVLWADERKQSDRFKKSRIIFPAMKTIRKWAATTFGKEDSSREDQYTSDMDAGGIESLDLGESFSRRKDPEHLPARNAFERIGNLIRLVPRGLRSDESAFGFRVAAATMSVAIVCYLQASQTWFLQNRILWAMIMVAISMTRTAGQSVATFILRIVGTTFAMIGAYIIWYIVDGITPGVIVFLWLWIFASYYVVLKKPKLIIVGIISLVTALLIIGYELEIQVIGRNAIESNGQPAYPVYLLAPYRLATVVGGLAVAFIWTIFPYPISESTELRKDLGASLYLLANFYSVLHEMVQSRIGQNAGHPDTKGSRAYHLERARGIVFNKLIALVSSLQMNIAFSKFQITLGGRFPREEYEGLIESVRRLLQYFSLLSYASATFATSDPTSKWSADFRRLLLESNHTSHQTTSLLALLSSSLLHGRPLPPYLDPPQSSRYVKRLNEIDKDILSVRHIAEPEYSAFAVIQVCAKCINQDMLKVKKHVKALVGEIDFSFHAVSTERNSEETLTSAQEKKLSAADED